MKKPSSSTFEGSLPKKHLGQNFLVDERVLQKIVRSCALGQEDMVVEIGPGRGGLTRLIAPRIRHLTGVEKDKDLIAPLREEFKDSNVTVVHDDFLRQELPAAPLGIKIIGNIPYHISTPILERLIAKRANIKEAFVTVQREFGQRLAAQPGSGDYGALSCFIQYHARVNILFPIKRGSFHPVPKVDSCFMRLDFQGPRAYHPRDEGLFFRIIRTVFTQRRKTMVNAAGELADKARMREILRELDLPLAARPETLSLQNFVDISNKLV